MFRAFVMGLAFFAVTQPASAIREYQLTFTKEEINQRLRSYFSPDELPRDERFGPERALEDPREYVRSSPMPAAVRAAAAGRKSALKKSLEGLYEANPYDRAGQGPKNSVEDRSANMALVEMIADYMEYNHRKRIAFPSSCLGPSELDVAGAEDPARQVQINYILFDFDKYPKLKELRYFGAEDAKKGPVLLLPGRAEPTYKWVEFAHELYRRGYGPIMAIDHRGQGLSSRVPWLVTGNPDRGEALKFTDPATEFDVRATGHVDLFRCYISDVNTFMTKVAPGLLEEWNRRPENKTGWKTEDVAVIGHSTGGAIAQGYLMLTKKLHQEPQPNIEAAPVPRKMFLISPMFGLVNIRNLSVLALKNLNWSAPWKLLNKLFLIGACKIAKDCLRYAEADTQFKMNLIHDDQNLTTHSAARYLHYRMLANLWPEAIITKLSVNWLEEASSFFKTLHADKEDYRDTVLKIYKGGDGDELNLEAERVVDNRALDRYCKERKGKFKDLDGTDSCLVIPFGGLRNWKLAGSRHAIHTEDDWYREPLLRDIDVHLTPIKGMHYTSMERHDPRDSQLLLHDMIFRCQEELLATWHRQEAFGARNINDLGQKTELQKELNKTCAPVEVFEKCGAERASSIKGVDAKRARVIADSQCLREHLLSRELNVHYHRIQK